MTDPRKPSRRQAIKYLIGGAAAAACPIPATVATFSPRRAAPESAGPAVETPEKLGSESNTLCHQVRDGARFDFPKPSRQYEIVVVGGGPSGLMSAYKLRDRNFLLLEKEPRLGGNAISEQWQGQWYSTGAAYGEDETLAKLCVEIGMEIHRIRSVDAAVINDELIPEYWTGGFWRSSYPEAAKKNIARFQGDMKGLDLEKNVEKLDAITFAELLKPYGPELKAWYDNFGPNNWGADTENTSAYIGADTVRWGFGVNPERWTWPGGLGRISLALEAALEKSGRDRIRKGATTVRVEQTGGKVEVSYFENGELVTVAGRAAIIACPKFIAKRIIRGLDDDHARAMGAMRYAPYLVVNACARQVIYNGSYDTNIPAPSPIVDFNVADWVESRDNKEIQRRQVLTCYVPRPETERVAVLNDDHCLEIGRQVVEHLERWFPGARHKIEEVHIYRRGHPMYLAAPGVLTRIAPRIRKPLGSVFFAHSDSEGGVSDYLSALRAATRAALEATEHIGRQARRQTVGM